MFKDDDTASVAPRIIGVSGGSASGKGTVVRQLLAHFGARAAVLCMDDYYLEKDQVPVDADGEPNFDVPESIDLERFARDVEQLRGGKDLFINSYTFNQPGVVSERLHIPATRLIFLDGLYLLHHPETRKQLHLSLWIAASARTRLDRRVKRDAAERSVPEHEVQYQWEHHVRPGEEAFLDPHVDGTDLTVENELDAPLDLQPVIDRLEALIA
jgi:uridine kinase